MRRNLGSLCGAIVLLASASVTFLAGCSASHTANSTSVLPGAPSSKSHENVDPFNISTKDIVYRYPLPNPSSGPFMMAIGSDKNVWFTERSAPRIGKITPGGAITEYSIPSGFGGLDIVAGAAGTLWFTEKPATNIGKISVTTGHITEFPLPTNHCASGIAKGPDGNMWFTEDLYSCAGGPSVGKITPTGTVTEYALGHDVSGYYVEDIVTGPDGALWFDEGDGYIGRITTSGSLAEYAGPDTSGLNGIAVGPDGNLYASAGSGMWKITTAGGISAIPGPSAGYDLVLGPDRQLWVSGEFGQLIFEFNPNTHVFSQTIAPDGGLTLGGLTVGGDGDLWIAGWQNNTIDVYEEKITTLGIRLNGELSFTDPKFGFELGYAIGPTSTQTQTISLSAGESVQFKNVDTIAHSAAFLGNATANSAPWPTTFAGSTIKSPAGTAIGTSGWTTGTLTANKTSAIYETGAPGFYMIGDQYDYVSNNMRTVVIVH